MTKTVKCGPKKFISLSPPAAVVAMPITRHAHQNYLNRKSAQAALNVVCHHLGFLCVIFSSDFEALQPENGIKNLIAPNPGHQAVDAHAIQSCFPKKNQICAVVGFVSRNIQEIVASHVGIDKNSSLLPFGFAIAVAVVWDVYFTDK